MLSISRVLEAIFFLAGSISFADFNQFGSVPVSAVWFQLPTKDSRKKGDEETNLTRRSQVPLLAHKLIRARTCKIWRIEACEVDPNTPGNLSE